MEVTAIASADMRRTSFLSFECPAARALESVGDWWSILILRDALQGLTRFDEFEQNLGVSPNILSRRLRHLTREGLFERRQYCRRPPRHEYILTAKGRDFHSVATALFAWGCRHLPPEERTMRLADRTTGEERQVRVADARTGEEITLQNTMILPGPAATESTYRHLAWVQTMRNKRIAQEKRKCVE